MDHQIDFRQRTAELAFRSIRARLAPLFALFDEEGVTEVNFNGPGEVWVTKLGRREQAQVIDVNEVTASAAVKELAASMGQEAEASTSSCVVDAKMPGFRFSAIMAPVASKGTAFAIRKHSPRVLSLEDYIQMGVINEYAASVLRDAVRRGLNVLIGGGTDSGKTTFLNALSREIPADERVGTIEDTRELSLATPNWLPLETNAQKGVTATLALKALMRQSPDRIICGELRDEVANDWISSANTGHHGIMATVHCSSAALALERLEDLCLKSPDNWPLHAIQRNIGRTINLVAHFAKINGRRLMTELLQVEGFCQQTQTYKTNSIFKLKETA